MRYHRTPTATNSAHDLEAVKIHARLDGYDEDVALDLMARTAAAEIEAATDCALLAQIITAEADTWGDVVPLPVGPFYAAGLADNPVTIQTRDEAGALTTHSVGWWIEPGRYPRLHLIDTIEGAALIVTYPAGYGLTVADVPPDLQLAVMDHAGMLYDRRTADIAPQGLSIAAARIIARHRRVKA